MKPAEAVAVIFVVLYNLAILGGCAWLVWHDWSAWWFVLAVMLLASVGNDEKEDDRG